MLSLALAAALAGGPASASPPLQADFAAQGASVVPADDGRWAFRAAPWGLGCDGALVAVGEARPEVRGRRVVYARPELDEWYETGPRGVEQGFTLRSPPACRREGGEGVVIALGAGLRAVVGAEGREAILGNAGVFGTSVALDGDTAIFGATGDPGAAYAFVRAGGTFGLQQALGVAGGPVGQFGAVVALSADTALVGAFGAPSAAYVFVRSGGAWAEQQMLAGKMNDNAFGSSVALQGDTAVVGSDVLLYAFGRAGTTWTAAPLVHIPSSLTSFTGALLLSGGTLFAGGVDETDNTNARSRIGVLAPSSGQLALQQMLDPSGLDRPKNGSLATDGSTLLVGLPDASAVSVLVLLSSNGDACTSAAACASGNCVDGVCCAAPVCPAAGACNAAEHCQPGTGVCSTTPVNEGMPCPSNACNRDATCHAGECLGAATACPPADACHEFGTCDPSSGKCSNPPKPDGTACPAGICVAGVCQTASAPAPPASGGCGCGVASGPAGGALGAGLALLFALRRRRPRRGSLPVA